MLLVMASAVRLEHHMVLKWKFRPILQKSLRIYESIILEISLSGTNFLILKLEDLKPSQIFKIFDAFVRSQADALRERQIKKIGI